MKRIVASVALAATICNIPSIQARLADRSRVVKARQQAGATVKLHDNGRAINGPAYRAGRTFQDNEMAQRATESIQQQKKKNPPRAKQEKKAPWKMEFPPSDSGDVTMREPLDPDRKLSSQLTGCCYDYQSYSASYLCAYYGQDCESGETPSHDSGDSDCSHDGLSFIGLSFSVNTAYGNPYSYQLCDQFPMENIIDRKYEYIMSMDEDGWLVGGGYKTFDYSGKMP